jgi:hypothetical protein
LTFACLVDRDVNELVMFAIDLLIQERKQRQILGGIDAVCFPCTHNVEFPVNFVDISALLCEVAKKCSVELRQEIETSLLIL